MQTSNDCSVARIQSYHLELRSLPEAITVFREVPVGFSPIRIFSCGGVLRIGMFTRTIAFGNAAVPVVLPRYLETREELRVEPVREMYEFISLNNVTICPAPSRRLLELYGEYVINSHDVLPSEVRREFQPVVDCLYDYLYSI